MPLHPLTVNIRTELEKAANPENAIAMQRYMKSELPYRGVKSPMQKLIYSKVLREFPVSNIGEYRRIISELWNAEFREERYAAITLSVKYKKYQTLEMLDLYKEMIVTGAWWDYVDSIAANLIGNLLLKFPEPMKNELNGWIGHENLWIRRVAILSQLKFKEKTDSQMLFRFCETCLEEQSFWIRKAIGWALREFSKTDKAAVAEFVDNHKTGMSGLTLREASKYL